MACSLLRSCTEVLREGKNTSNAQKIIYKTQNQEDLLQNPPDFLFVNFAQRLRPFPAFFFVRVPGDFIDSLSLPLLLAEGFHFMRKARSLFR